APETLNLTNPLDNQSVDLGLGFSTINLADGNNTGTLSNAEFINAFGSGSDNITVELDPSIVNQIINLGFGTDTLTLAGTNGNISISVAGGNLTVIGATTAVDEHVNLLNVQGGTTFYLGAGTDDSRTLFGESGFFGLVTVVNIETVTGSGFGDGIVIANTSGTTTLTGGWGADTMTASA